MWRSAMAARARAGSDVAIGLHPLIKGRAGFGRSLVMPFDPPTRSRASFYFVTRAEQAKRHRIAGFRRWISEAVQRLAS